jgi:hypothetical protein
LLADSAFKQQRLRVWRPILSAKVAIISFFATGLVFVPIGTVLAAVTNQVCAGRPSDCRESPPPF